MKTNLTLKLKTAIFSLLLMTAFAFPVEIFSQWSQVPVSAAPNDQTNPTIVSDGSGGAIMTWQDKRNGSTYDIYAQRMNSTGTPLWSANGVVICSADSSQINPRLVADGSGGAIICWEDKRNATGWDIYSQRVNSNGIVQWATNGLPVCTVVFEQDTLAMVGDGIGGAILTWQDYRSNNGFADIYAQRISTAGVMLWTANGVSICNQAAAQRGPKVLSDGTGGAFITWADNRAGNFDIYTQRISTGGAVQWTTNGVATCTMATDQLKPDICSDGAAGVIITWTDFRSTTDFNIYAQRQGPAGAIVWTVDGIVMNNNVAYEQTDPKIISDGVGGAIISWTDYRTGITADIYAQRVNSTGAVQWTATGIIICTATGDQIKSQLVSDGNSGAYIVWEDHRNAGNSDIYAQRIASNAAINWSANGVIISSAVHDQLNPMMVIDGNLGAIVVWQDFRNNSNYDIYAAGFNTSTGIINTSTLAEKYNLSQNYPNPFNPTTKIEFAITKQEFVSLKIYDIQGREAAVLVNGNLSSGTYSINWDAAKFQTGVYFYKLVTNSFSDTKKMMLVK